MPMLRQEAETFKSVPEFKGSLGRRRFNLPLMNADRSGLADAMLDTILSEPGTS